MNKEYNIFTTEELDLDSIYILNELDDESQSELAEVLRFELDGGEY